MIYLVTAYLILNCRALYIEMAFTRALPNSNAFCTVSIPVASHLAKPFDVPVVHTVSCMAAFPSINSKMPVSLYLYFVAPERRKRTEKQCVYQKHFKLNET